VPDDGFPLDDFGFTAQEAFQAAHKGDAEQRPPKELKAYAAAAQSRGEVSKEGVEQAKGGKFRIKGTDKNSKVRACGTRLLLLPRPPRLLSHLLLLPRPPAPPSSHSPLALSSLAARRSTTRGSRRCSTSCSRA
jgi:hypothetical protein